MENFKESLKVNTKIKNKNDIILELMEGIKNQTKRFLNQGLPQEDKQAIIDILEYLENYEENQKILKSFKKKVFSQEEMNRIEKEDMGYKEK